MSLTREESRLLDDLCMSANETCELVQAAGQAVVDELHSAGFKPPQDDRRAALDAAIFKYLLSCSGD